MSNYPDSDDGLYRDGSSYAATEEPTAVHQQHRPQQVAPQHQPHEPHRHPHGHGQSYSYGPPHGYGQPQGYGYGSPWGSRPRRQFPIETKPFFLTSEFVGAVLAIAGIAITAASSDAFGAWRAWILITAVLVGYMVSRGIAKSGTRSHSADPRENLDLNWGRGDSND